jgi:signal peptidase II
MSHKVMEFNKKIFLSFIIVLVCFIIDRASKIYIIDTFSQINVSNDIYVNPYLNFILLWNKGIAFGLLQSERMFYHIISVVILIIIFFVCFLIYQSKKKWEIIYFSLIVGGAIGNFTDRIYYMAVPDFIDLHYKDFHWFTFNVADICITFGIMLYLIFDMFRIKNAENE